MTMAVMESTSLRFARVARLLAADGRRRGLAVPSFRSPPRVAGADRTVRQGDRGAATVAVAIQGRRFEAVVADMIEGVVVVNRLEGLAAMRVRTGLWQAVADELEVAA